MTSILYETTTQTAVLKEPILFAKYEGIPDTDRPGVRIEIIDRIDQLETIQDELSDSFRKLFPHEDDDFVPFQTHLEMGQPTFVMRDSNTNEIVGHVALTELQHTRENAFKEGAIEAGFANDTRIMVSLGIQEAYQEKGLGKLLVQTCIDYLQEIQEDKELIANTFTKKTNNHILLKHFPFRIAHQNDKISVLKFDLSHQNTSLINGRINSLISALGRILGRKQGLNDLPPNVQKDIWPDYPKPLPTDTSEESRVDISNYDIRELFEEIEKFIGKIFETEQPENPDSQSDHGNNEPFSDFPFQNTIEQAFEQFAKTFPELHNSANFNLRKLLEEYDIKQEISNSAEGIIQKITEIIQTHKNILFSDTPIDDKILQIMSEASGLEKVYLNRLQKEHPDFTIKEYIRHLLENEYSVYDPILLNKYIETCDDDPVKQNILRKLQAEHEQYIDTLSKTIPNLAFLQAVFTGSLPWIFSPTPEIRDIGGVVQTLSGFGMITQVMKIWKQINDNNRNVQVLVHEITGDKQAGIGAYTQTWNLIQHIINDIGASHPSIAGLRLGAGLLLPIDGVFPIVAVESVFQLIKQIYAPYLNTAKDRANLVKELQNIFYDKLTISKISKEPAIYEKIEEVRDEITKIHQNAIVNKYAIINFFIPTVQLVLQKFGIIGLPVAIGTLIQSIIADIAYREQNVTSNEQQLKIIQDMVNGEMLGKIREEDRFKIDILGNKRETVEEALKTHISHTKKYKLLRLDVIIHNQTDEGKILSTEFVPFSSEHHFITIMGRSGSGKTTLLKRIQKYMKIQDEKAIFLNAETPLIESIFKSILDNPESTLTKQILENNHISLDNLQEEFESIFLNLSGAHPIEASLHKNIINNILEYFAEKLIIQQSDISKLFQSLGQNVSDGQKAAILILQALSYNPKVLLLDELLAKLDKTTRENIIGNILNGYLKSNPDTLCLVTSHDETLFDEASGLLPRTQLYIMGSGESTTHEIDKIYKTENHKIIRKFEKNPGLYYYNMATYYNYTQMDYEFARIYLLKAINSELDPIQKEEYRAILKDWEKDNTWEEDFKNKYGKNN